MGTESVEASFLSIFALMSFFIFLILSKYSHNFFTGVRDKISQFTERSEDVDEKNDEIINRYFSDDEDSNADEMQEPLVRYKPIFYASAIHPTNSIPLNHG